jgi:hypothetical protein
MEDENGIRKNIDMRNHFDVIELVSYLKNKHLNN